MCVCVCVQLTLLAVSAVSFVYLCTPQNSEPDSCRGTELPATCCYLCHAAALDSNALAKLLALALLQVRQAHAALLYHVDSLISERTNITETLQFLFHLTGGNFFSQSLASAPPSPPPLSGGNKNKNFHLVVEELSSRLSHTQTESLQFGRED